MAASTGLLLYHKYKATEAKYFIWFLIYVVLMEFIGMYPSYFSKFGITYIIEDSIFEYNYWYYTIFWFMGSTLFYIFYYRKILTDHRFKDILKYIGILFIIGFAVNIFISWKEFFDSFFPFVNILGAFIILLCLTFYFIEMLQSDQILSFYKSLNFYISATLLVWWLVITPLVFYNIYFSTADWNFVFLRRDIYLFVNIFMYSSFTFALPWCRPQNNS